MGGKSLERHHLEKRAQGKPVLPWPSREELFYVHLSRLGGQPHWDSDVGKKLESRLFCHPHDFLFSQECRLQELIMGKNVDNV